MFFLLHMFREPHRYYRSAMAGGKKSYQLQLEMVSFRATVDFSGFLVTSFSNKR